MKRNSIILLLALILIFSSSNISYASQDKTILILLDELSFEDIEKLFADDGFGIGFMNIKTRKPYGDESLYFSIATGRKVGIKSEDYRGLYKTTDGTIHVAGFQEMLKNLMGKNKRIKLDILGEKLKGKDISYIGDNSSAIIAADKDGNIESGEIEINYDIKWLEEKTDYHLAKSNVLVLSYDVEESDHRIELLKKYIRQYREHNILLIPKNVSSDMKYILNKNLAPVIYVDGNDKGLITSSSTKREGFITVEDLFVQLLHTNDMESPKSIGNFIHIEPEEGQFKLAQQLFKKTINLIWIASIFHGLVYFMQVYSAYYIYKNRKDKFEDLNLYNSFIIVNIFISLLMGLSSLHINIVLYLFINLLVTYIITVYMADKEINTIGLFATFTYGIILLGIFFYPELIYNSYIGFNNLFYGARYYGFNNGIMGVLLVSSIISYYFIKELMPNKFVDYMVCILFFLVNMVALSANYGANTGGFITSVALFLIMIYTNLLEENLSIYNIILLVFVGILIFGINMYFDYHSNEKSHAINFLVRIKTFGFGEFLDMFKVKARELLKLTLLPPFSIVIISQIISLKSLLKGDKSNLNRIGYTILLVSIIGFIINDTGMITFIYMIHYLISLLIYNRTTKPSNS